MKNTRKNNVPRKLAAHQALRTLLENPEEIGKLAGFRDLTKLHGKWIRQIVYGTGDYTLQAHRGSYKSSSLAVGIALMMILDPKHNIIFLRKADDDVQEMIGMVSKILRLPVMNDICMVLYGIPIQFTADNADRISTSLWSSPMGAPQLLGIGIKSSITGKHAQYVITDDICNIQDYLSSKERKQTKLQYDELQNIRNRGGRIINLGTPWHKDDVFRKMPNIHRYDCYQTGLISKEKLAELQSSMAPHMFAANYELKLISNADLIFTEPPRFIDEIDPYFIQMGMEGHIDAAYGGSDYTAFTAAYYDRDNEIIYMYGRLWHQDVQNVLPEILDEARRLGCWRICCENNSDRGFLCDSINENDLFGKEYHEQQNKKNKILTYLRKCWRRIVFIQGTDPKYIRQITEYTEHAEHDDAPDSAATVCRFFLTHDWDGR